MTNARTTDYYGTKILRNRVAVLDHIAHLAECRAKALGNRPVDHLDAAEEYSMIVLSRIERQAVYARLLNGPC